jgi:hypothetical protein
VQIPANFGRKMQVRATKSINKVSTVSHGVSGSPHQIQRRLTARARFVGAEMRLFVGAPEKIEGTFAVREWSVLVQPNQFTPEVG